MGMNLSRRCFRCKAVLGWDATNCAYCRYREGNDTADKLLGADEYGTGNPVQFQLGGTTSQVLNSVCTAFVKMWPRRLWQIYINVRPSRWVHVFRAGGENRERVGTRIPGAPL